MTEELTKVDIMELDLAFMEMKGAMIGWCNAVAEHPLKLKQISKRYGIGLSLIKKMNVIGQNTFKFIDEGTGGLIDNLPEGYNALYLLSALTPEDVHNECIGRVPKIKDIKAARVYAGIDAEAPKQDMLLDEQSDCEVIHEIDTEEVLEYIKDCALIDDIAEIRKACTAKAKLLRQ